MKLGDNVLEERAQQAKYQLFHDSDVENKSNTISYSSKSGNEEKTSENSGNINLLFLNFYYT